ncbi:conjugative transposon protein TraM [candidate division KSB1 bacterium]|nr:conjugative transposon protein TraM [candidate division KSB1 bacterium]
MNLEKTFFETKNGQRRLKPQMVMLLSVSAFVIFILIVFAMRGNKAAPKKIEGPYSTRTALPQPKLDYNMVKLDTFALGDYYRPKEEPSVEVSRVREGRSTEQATRSESLRRRPEGEAQVTSTPRYFGSSSNVVDRNPNMIVYSSLASNQVTGGSVLGLQSALLKVILPEKTAVTNNSLVEARVMTEASLGSINIPRRAQLIGTASLQNSRVQIDFREIRINGVTRTCSGRAFDLKKLPGLAYTPLDAATRKAVLDELRSAASALPIVGRYANQTEINPFNEEVARLEEGQEFYVQITNIF